MKRSLSNLATLALCVLTAFVACGDDEEESEPLRPAGPPSIHVKGFYGPDNRLIERGDSNQIEICGTTLVVALDQPENWTLRPPGRCGETPQCGHIAIRVDPSETGDGAVTEAASTTVSVDLSGLDPLEGPHLLRAELRLGTHAPFLDGAGMPFVDDVDIELTPVTCAQSGTGGQGGQGSGGQGPGTGGVPGSGGAPAVGGQGGAAGEGGTGGI